VLIAWIEGADHISIYDRPEYRENFSLALDRVLAAEPLASAKAS
jgi:hypothetical protein